MMAVLFKLIKNGNCEFPYSWKDTKPMIKKLINKMDIINVSDEGETSVLVLLSNYSKLHEITCFISY